MFSFDYSSRSLNDFETLMDTSLSRRSFPVVKEYMISVVVMGFDVVFLVFEHTNDDVVVGMDGRARRKSKKDTLNAQEVRFGIAKSFLPRPIKLSNAFSPCRISSDRWGVASLGHGYPLGDTIVVIVNDSAKTSTLQPIPARLRTLLKKVTFSRCLLGE